MAATITDINRSQSSSSQQLVPLTMETSQAENEEELNWMNRFREYIYTNILPVVDPNPESRKMYVTAAAMKVWMAAFTHKSYDPNPGKNYEVLEKVGDKIMEVHFVWFIINKFRTINESGISHMTNYYVAKTFQAQIAEQLGLDRDFIRTRIDVNRSTKEDAVESLFGGLYFIADTMIPKLQLPDGRLVGMADYATRRLVEFIYGQIDYDLNILKGPVINQVKEIFDKMEWEYSKKVLQELETENKIQSGEHRGKIQFVLSFNRPFMEWVKKQNELRKAYDLKHKEQIERGEVKAMGIIPITEENKVFGVGLHFSKQEARRMAYINALNVLAYRYGITWDWADKYRKSLPLSKITGEWFAKAKARAISEGYEDIKFSSIRKGTTALYLQLYGIKHNSQGIEHLTVLATVDGTEGLPFRNYGEQVISDDDMQAAVSKLYAEYGMNPQAVTYYTIFPKTFASSGAHTKAARY